MVPRPFKELDIEDNGEAAVVVVTPYSTGSCIALELQDRGYKLICLWNNGFSEIMKTHVPVACQGKLNYDITLEESSTIEETAAMIRDVCTKKEWHLHACVCGGEAGVDLADALSEQLDLLTNGTDIENRRDKKVQQDLIKKAGLRSIRQQAGTCFEEVREFLENETYPVVIKPVDSAGSDGVKICRSFEEAKTHFQFLIGMKMVNGPICEEALCQEYLKGKEYVVDQVSRDGVHKTVMCWLYDKRPVNGADFVYFGDIPIDPKGPECQQMIPYARAVLDALGVRNGPSHGEIIMTSDGPCLVEMNCRAHGGDGLWREMEQAMTGGYSQIEAAVDSYVDQSAFEILPDMPPSPLLESGQCVDMVSYVDGFVKSTTGYDLIKTLPSFKSIQTHIKSGSKVNRTIDMATDIGCVVLLNKDPISLARDVSIIRHLESNNLMFEFYSSEEAEWLQKREQFMAKACSLDFEHRTLKKIGKRPTERLYRRIIATNPYCIKN